MKKLLSLFAFGITVCLVTWFIVSSKQSSFPLPNQTSVTTAATIINPPKPLPQFSLQDMFGQPFNQNSFLGHWTFMFFGYADCPDVCPATLAITNQLWRSYPDQKPHPKARFVFVTLNPKEDTAQNLKVFLKGFHNEFLGVTGSEEAINNLSNSLNIFSYVDPNKTSNGKTFIDHSATILLINPEGRLQALFSPPHQIENIKKDLQILLNR